MKTTYDEILSNMKNAFFEKCGENVDLMGDIGARFQAVASELFSVYCYGDFIMKQAFPQTATGEYLDYHAQLRNMQRKSPDRARGTLTFSVSQPAETEVVIEKGTVCSVKDSPFIQFQTEETVSIAVGETEVDVGAVALECGKAYNAPADSITVMVNPPLGVSQVRNMQSFKGGYDEEGDLSLRNRILSSYSVASTGVSVQSLRDVVLKNDNILDCLIEKNDEKTILVYVKTKDNVLTSDVVKQVCDSMMIADITGMSINIILSTPQNFSLYIEAHSSNSNKNEIKANVQKAVDEFCDSLTIEEDLDLNRIAWAMSSVEGVSYCDMGSKEALNGLVVCGKGRFLNLNETVVICYD